jgi:hypothetical protein
MVNEILTNVGTIVAFRSSSAADEKQLLPVFSDIQQGNILNLPRYSFYTKIPHAQNSHEVLSGTTVIASKVAHIHKFEVISASRSNNSIKVEELSKKQDRTSLNQKERNTKKTPDDGLPA